MTILTLLKRRNKPHFTPVMQVKVELPLQLYLLYFNHLMSYKLKEYIDLSMVARDFLFATDIGDSSNCFMPSNHSQYMLYTNVTNMGKPARNGNNTTNDIDSVTTSNEMNTTGIESATPSSIDSVTSSSNDSAIETDSTRSSTICYSNYESDNLLVGPISSVSELRAQSLKSEDELTHSDQVMLQSVIDSKDRYEEVYIEKFQPLVKDVWTEDKLIINNRTYNTSEYMQEYIKKQKELKAKGIIPDKVYPPFESYPALLSAPSSVPAPEPIGDYQPYYFEDQHPKIVEIEAKEALERRNKLEKLTLHEPVLSQQHLLESDYYYYDHEKYLLNTINTSPDSHLPPTNGSSLDKTPANETLNKTPANKPLLNETPANKPLLNETPANKTPANEPLNKTPANEPLNETPANETPANKLLNKTPLNKTPANKPLNGALSIEVEPVGVPSKAARLRGLSPHAPRGTALYDPPPFSVSLTRVAWLPLLLIEEVARPRRLLEEIELVMAAWSEEQARYLFALKWFLRVLAILLLLCIVHYVQRLGHMQRRFSEGTANMPSDLRIGCVVYLDIECRGRKMGRVVIGLFTEDYPLYCEYFHRMCVASGGNVHGVSNAPGRQGSVATSTSGDSFRGKRLVSLIPHTACVFGDGARAQHGIPGFNPHWLPTERESEGAWKGALSALSYDREKQSPNFMIHIRAGVSTPQVFGMVLSGWEVIENISNIGIMHGSVPKQEVIIANCGELCTLDKSMVTPIPWPLYKSVSIGYDSHHFGPTEEHQSIWS